MPLETGRALSHYAILGPLGVGAMGEVYRAQDTRLGREVAIKVLPPQFADDPERLARFEREARSLASLNHPNIAQIFGVDDVDGVCFLALELVPGETLQDRLARGPLPVDEALDVGRQVAEGLEAAHEAGVIHRDLKPANVRLTPDGKVKLLDFGLAKSTGVAGESGDTFDSVLSTEAGRLLGTPTYMAPEQARGRAIDRRVDVWAFGCVMYEALTGARAFAGETLSDTLAAVLHTEPELDRLPRDVPPRLRELLADCLVKDPRGRLRDAGEIRRQLERAIREPSGASGAAGTPGAARPGRGREVAAWAVAALALAALVSLLLRAEAPPAAAPVVRASLELPLDFTLSEHERPLALSPDGRLLVVSGSRAEGGDRLWARRLDGTELQPLAGTEGAQYAFFSPDGLDLAFFADGKLRRMPAAGGNVVTVCASEDSRGGAWGRRGEMYFTPSAFSPLLRVPATGGTPVPITETEGSESHRLPHVLPDGRRLLYTRMNTDVDGIYVLDLETGASRRILEAMSDAHFVAPDLLVFARDQDLLVQDVDPGTLALVGEARVVAEDVPFRAFRRTGTYAVSADGQLVHGRQAKQRRLHWVEPDGRAGEAFGTPAPFESLTVSPSGRQIVATLDQGDAGADIWLLDATRGLGTRVLEGVVDSGDAYLLADERTIAYTRLTGSGFGKFVTHVRTLDGSAPERELPGGWCSHASADGQWLLLCAQVPGTGFDVRALRTDGTGEPIVIAASAANELGAWFSPDGRWVVYTSDVSGRSELILQPFPGPGPSRQVTPDGITAQGPTAWLADGRIVFRDVDDERRLLSILVDTTGPMPVIGTPLPCFGGLPVADGPATLSPDGTRLLVARRVDAGAGPSLELLLNGLRPVAPH